MPPILWTLVAALVPNLLGFLFYFAMRKSVAPPCPHCGQALEDGRRFLFVVRSAIPLCATGVRYERHGVTSHSWTAFLAEQARTRALKSFAPWTANSCEDIGSAIEFTLESRF